MMITLLDIKKSINDVLSKYIRNVKIYSNDIKEGFERPCFFTQVINMGRENETINYVSNKVMVVINYFSKNKTEIENMKMDEDLKNAFGMNLKVKERSFFIQSIRSNIVDEILQFKFDIEYFEYIGRNKDLEEEYEVIRDIKFKYKGDK